MRCSLVCGGSGEFRQVWMSRLPESDVIMGCSLRVANVYTWPVSDATSNITCVPVSVESSYACGRKRMNKYVISGRLQVLGRFKRSILIFVGSTINRLPFHLSHATVLCTNCGRACFGSRILSPTVIVCWTNYHSHRRPIRLHPPTDQHTAAARKPDFHPYALVGKV